MNSSNTYAHIFQIMDEIIIIHELVYENGSAVNYRILDVNPAFEKAYNLQKTDVINRLATDVYQVDEPPFLDRYIRVVESSEHDRFEMHPKNIHRTFLVSVYPDDENRFVSIATDISSLPESEPGIKPQGDLVPICANCKKIRDKENKWEPVEAFINRHIDVRLSHGICPDCMKVLYPGFVNDNNKDI